MVLFKKVMRKGFLAPLLLVLLGFTTTAYSEQILVGSDGGSASVDNSGQAVWSMPVEVPSGVLGLAPKMQLSVTSGGGNGTLGVGGALSGMSMITRCSKSLEYDGYVQTPQYTKDDAYCLDGQRLLLQSGVYGEPKSVYRTAVESFQKVLAVGTDNNNGPNYFYVYNRSGAYTIYGASVSHSSYQYLHEVDHDTGVKTAWRPFRLEDTKGNRLSYSYRDLGSHQVGLNYITYGYNKDTSTLNTRLYINFAYEDRPDVVSGFSRGKETALSKRINKIYMRVNSEGGGIQPHSEYRISYRQGEVSGLSRIASVQQCAGDGDCYNPTVFNYKPEEVTQWQTSNLSVPAALIDAQGKPLGVMIDLNNDGKSDWVQSYRSATGVVTNRTWLHSAFGWSESTQFKLPGVLFDYQAHIDGFPVGSLVDINSDGWPDYIQAHSKPSVNQRHTYRNTGVSFVLDASLALPVVLNTLSNNQVIARGDLVDVNGDALLDIVRSLKLPDGVITQKTYLHNFSNGVHSWVENADFSPPVLMTDYAVSAEGRVYASLQDVNGDGMVDVVQSFKQDGVLTANTWLNTGKGWQLDVAYATPQANINYDMHTKGVPEYIFNDVNGDGLPDLVKAIFYNGTRHFDTLINTGLTWERDTNYNLPTPLLTSHSNGNIAILGSLSDINSDGLPDVLRSYIDSSNNFISERFLRVRDKWEKQDSSSPLGQSFPIATTQLQTGGKFYTQTGSADIDNDGFPEYFGLTQGNTAVYASTSAGAAHAPGSWLGTTNPLGAKTEFYYGLSTDSSVYETAPQTAYPDVAANGAMRLVREIRASNGLNDMVSAYHTYGKAKTNLRGLGGYGFAFHDMEDANSGIKVSTKFHQIFPYAGKLKASKKSRQNKVFQASESSMAIKDINIGSLTTLYPYPNWSESYTYDNFGNLVTTKTSAVDSLDEYGNTLISTEIIKDNSGIIEQRKVIKDVTYKNNTSRWILGMPDISTQTITGLNSEGIQETFTNKSQVIFYPNSNKVHQEIIEPDSSNAVTKTYTYDLYGNRITSTTSAKDVASNTTTSEYSADGRFPIKVTNQLGHSVTTKFDPVLSKPLEITDANGIMKEFLYDGFGTTLRETKKHQSNGTTRGRQVVFPRFCENAISGANDVNCPEYAVYYVAAFDDEGEAPEIAYYDVNGKELRKQTYGYDGKIIVVDTQYDKDSKVIKKSKPYFKGASEQDKNWTSFTYDDVGRQIKRSNNGRHYYTRYLGLTAKGIEVEQENPGNKDTPAQVNKIISNIFGKPIESIDAAGTSTKYEYDIRGNLLKTIDAENNVATIEYEPIFGRKIKMNDPDLGQWSYQYNALGQMVRQTDAKGQKTEMTYDVLGRMVTRVDAAGTPSAETTHWTYDGTEEGDINGGLKRIELINPSINNKYSRETTYDEFSRAIETTTVNHNVTYQQRVGYNGTADKQDWVQYPTGLAVRSTYDDYGYPKTVEGIQLNLPGYNEFIAESKELARLQRAFQAWKEKQANFSEIEQLESQIRAKGLRLSNFYDTLKTDDQYNDAELQAYQNEAKRFQDLVKLVGDKVTQHSNWINIYSTDQKNRLKIIKNDLASLKTKQIESYHLNSEYEVIKSKYDQFSPYLSTIKHHQNTINTHTAYMKQHVANIFNNTYKVLFTGWINQGPAGLDKFGNYLQKHAEWLAKNARKPGVSLDLYSGVMNGGILNDFTVIGDQAEKIEHQQNKMTVKGSSLGMTYEEIVESLNTKGDELNAKNEEASVINDRVKPHLNRINNWLAPNITSHNHIIQAYNDRLRVYLYAGGNHELGFGCSADSKAAYPCTGKQLNGSVATINGSYVERESLAVDTFLKPFLNHINYAKCLRDQTAKTSGQCYAEHLVHDDNATKQTQARAAVDAYAAVDTLNFWSENRFFCSYYRGYSCPAEFTYEIKQLAKTINELQCTKKTAKPDPIDITLSKTLPTTGLSYYDRKYRTCVTAEKAKYHWLAADIQRIDSNFMAFQTAITNKHKAKVEQLVRDAQKDTYHKEPTSFDDIVAGKLWQLNPNDNLTEDQQTDDWRSDVLLDEIEEQKKSDEEFAKYVLIFKGRSQTRTAQLMSAETREAVATLRADQEQLQTLLGAAYTDHYLAIQAQSKKVQDFYQQLDEAFLAAQERDAYESSKKVYWEAQNINAEGQIKKAKYGNGLITDWKYDEFGRITSHASYKTGQANLVNTDYEYDVLGNLSYRNDKVEGLQEDFSYDIMNRLVTSDLSGESSKLLQALKASVTTFEYDALGNITYKSDISGFAGDNHYTYGEIIAGKKVRPHAVTNIGGLVEGNFTYDANGNQLTGNGRSINYTAFNKPWRIINDGDTTLMRYGPERQMIWKQEPQKIGETTETETTAYIGGGYEAVYVPDEDTTHKHSITVAGRAIAIVETKGALNGNTSSVVTKESYLHKNHQGSIIAITDIAGEIVERRHYDAFGKMRTMIGDNGVFNDVFTHNPITDMSFTGHQFLQAAGVIHMKGRVYDAVIGRFLSADPHIQSPLNSQSLNRYAYVLNNPLSLVDPSGYFFSKLFKKLKRLFDKIKKIIKKIVRAIQKIVRAIGKTLKKIGKYIKKYARVIVAVVLTVVTAGAMAAAGYGMIISGMAAGAVSGLVTTGSLKGMLEGAFFGAVTGGFASWAKTAVTATSSVLKAFEGVASAIGTTSMNVVKVLAHGVIGGLRSVVKGGKFLAGFISGAVGKAVTMAGNAVAAFANSGPITQGLIVATAGGIAAQLTGGEFAGGFIAAGVGFAANHYNSEMQRKIDAGKKSDLTWDKHTNARTAKLHPEMMHRTRNFINQVEGELGIKLRVSDGFRSFQKQDNLFSQGRFGNSGNIVTQVRGGGSSHNFGMAVDIAEIDSRYAGGFGYDRLAATVGIAQANGLSWGGDWKTFVDKPHFYLPATTENQTTYWGGGL